MRAQGSAAWLLPRAAGALGLLTIVGLGCGAPAVEVYEARPVVSAAALGSVSVAPARSAAPSEPPSFAALLEGVRADVDYVAVGPREVLRAVEPLLVHREGQGHVVARLAVEDLLARRRAGASDAQAVAAGITAVASKVGARLRFVLLVGDAPAPGEAASGFTPLPAFYMAKVGRGERRPRARARRAPQVADSARADEASRTRLYASDLPYAYANRGAEGQPDLAEEKAPPPLAVGRVPSRSVEGASRFAQKAIEYDTAKAEGAWRRRLEIIGGPANFGPVADFLIEGTATRSLDNDIPYDYDVRVAFLKMESPYVLPFPDARRRLMGDLNEGALIAVYVGHGASTSFAYIRHSFRYYAVGTTEDAEALRILDGKPFFISITCNTGEFDLPDNQRSLAEGMLLNPDGPIAVFASSRESHPYPNALYGQAFVEAFMKRRAANLGEGILEVKRLMRSSDIPLAPILFDDDPEALAEEHEGLYNLFGDPATRLRYPAKAELSLAGAGGEVAPGASLTVALSAPDVLVGAAALTVETRRSVIRGKLVALEKLKAMPERELWAAMGQNYAMASDKVVARSSERLKEGRATFRVKAPREPGDYELKVLAAGGGEAAVGHLHLRVKARGAR